MEIMSDAMNRCYNKYKGFNDYYEYWNNFFKNKKNMICEALENSKLRLKIFEPQGGHFIMADIT